MNFLNKYLRIILERNHNDHWASKYWAKGRPQSMRFFDDSKDIADLEDIMRKVLENGQIERFDAGSDPEGNGYICFHFTDNEKFRSAIDDMAQKID